MRRWQARVAVLFVCLSAIAAAAQDPGPAATLTIGGDVASPMVLSLADLRALPRTTATVDDHGTQVTFEGVLVGELLKRAGVPLGADLRGRVAATYVLASATDGYQAVFSLAEADPAFTGSTIFVADTANGKPLPKDQGPLKIVAPGDKRGARAIRMLHRLDVVRLRK